MGIYINKGNEEFRSALRGEYVDKSGLIAVVNNTLLSRQRFSCVTRSRRFGKSLAAMMLYAYYDHSCDSRQLFADLEIAHHPSFEEHLNKYPTIFIDMTDFLSRDMSVMDIVPTLEREVKADVRAAYPEAVVDPDDDLMAVLTKTALHYGEQFVFIIDEWDAICREALGNEAAMEKYVKLLRRLFKGGNSQRVFAAVYMTGILPNRVPAPQERQQARLGHRAEERPRRHYADQGMSLPPAGRTVHWRHASRGHQLR